MLIELIEEPATQLAAQIQDPLPQKQEVEESRFRIWPLIWPILVYLLSPFLWIMKILLTVYLRLYTRFVTDHKISNKAKCPACGIRQIHEIQYSPGYESVIHSCKNCKAEWGEHTIIPVDRWRIERSLKEVEEQPEGGTKSAWGGS